MGKTLTKEKGIGRRKFLAGKIRLQTPLEKQAHRAFRKKEKRVKNGMRMTSPQQLSKKDHQLGGKRYWEYSHANRFKKCDLGHRVRGGDVHDKNLHLRVRRKDTGKTAGRRKKGVVSRHRDDAKGRCPSEAKQRKLSRRNKAKRK